MKQKRRKAQSGQALLEYVLLIAISATLWSITLRYFKTQETFKQLVGGAWERLSNTIEFGVPTNRRNVAASRHPVDWNRHSTKRPTER
jgi:predicted permease